MAITPNIKPKSTAAEGKICARCGIKKSFNSFCYTRNIFYADGHIPLCHKCVSKYLNKFEYSWDAVNKVCQWADIPFIVKEWERLSAINDKENVWEIYSKIFQNDEYQDLGWSDYDKQYKRLKEVGLIEEELPEIREEKYRALRKKWGANYDEDELNQLESLYKGILTTQNVNGALQNDQAEKLCKISLEVDSRIRAGDKDVDKFLASYDKLVKIADFTPKNTKNAADFDSIAELSLWLEKRGKQNRWYDGTTRDVIDETLKNIETYNQRLYVNEGGIGEEINNRLRALNMTEEQENVYNIQTDFSEDEYDNAGFVVEDQEDFDPGV